MIRVAVCDDDEQIIKILKKYLDEKAEKLHNETLNISLYQSAVDFLQDTDKGLVFHIVFMDIEMDGIDGVEAGNILRNSPNGDETIIIYISLHDNFYKEIVDVGSFRFIKKPIDLARLDDVFSRALSMAIKYRDALCTPSIFRYKVGKESCSVKLDDIVYFKKDSRTIELYTWASGTKSINYTDKFYATFEEIIEELPSEQFIQCNRQFILNLKYVAILEKDSFLLMDMKKSTVAIGRAYKNDVKARYFKYTEGTT